ncbi:NADPH-dependent F420 reductase [Swingsia samuiensis]|uniref:Oxidoreductase n=1 Tax=Swingsia samuiensis TaxID=1293412 RepID=A0A4Y6UGN2_9PROT|nr:NAD(P)-binding domain-containing protein [Swingsia samuiensis]QDH16732.1 oxidoreductase [Swingsia samuiensis]
MTTFPLRRRPFLAAMAGLAAINVASGLSEVEAAPSITIGIIGVGDVGSTLAELWVKAGYQVILSARDEADAQKEAQILGSLASAGTPVEVANKASIIVLAVPYKAIPELGQALNRTLMDKIVIDPSNPYPWRDGEIAQEALKLGAGVVTQRYFPSAHVVRAFNSIDMSTLREEAHRSAPLLAIPVAGDDAHAVHQVEQLVTVAGFEPVLVGGLDKARLFQPGSDGFEVKESAAGLKQALHL